MFLILKICLRISQDLFWFFQSYLFFFGISHHRNMNDAGVGQALEPPPMMALVSKGNPEGTCEQMWSTLNAILLNVILWIYDIYLYSIIYIYMCMLI